MKQTAMQQLLNQLKDERQKLPMDIEWDRCYQAIEMVIKNTYLPMEKADIIETFKHAQVLHAMNETTRGEKYYNETFEGGNK